MSGSAKSFTLSETINVELKSWFDYANTGTLLGMLLVVSERYTAESAQRAPLCYGQKLVWFLFIFFLTSSFLERFLLTLHQILLCKFARLGSEFSPDCLYLLFASALIRSSFHSHVFPPGGTEDQESSCSFWTKVLSFSLLIYAFLTDILHSQITAC